MVVNRIIINRIQMLIKSIQIVDMGIRLFVVTMISILKMFNFIEVKMLFINSWKKFWKKFDIVKV